MTEEVTKSRLKLEALATILLLAGCEPAAPHLIVLREPAPGPPVDIGSISDVETLAGPRTGFSVRECRREDAIRGVDCLGSIASPHSQRGLTQLHDVIDRAMRPTARGVGFGLGCDESDRGFRVYVEHHAAIDAAIERAGQLCVELDTRARFTFHIVVQEQLL
jgi:hypothetical protein